MMVRLGVLTPSSNTVLEPLTAAMLAAMPGGSAHFSRFPVTEIALTPGTLGQFDAAPVLDAAVLLPHAKVGAIVWSGTAAAWRDFNTDAALCDSIRQRTGIHADTSVLAANRALRALGARRFGLVSPYTADVQARIVANCAAAGWDCVAERHLGLRDNFSFAAVGAEAIGDAIRAVAAAVWGGVATAGTGTAPLAGWGRIFGLAARTHRSC